MSLRQDLIASAVAFLRDPSVAQSPLAKRLQFLESKGLTPPETDEALRQASSGGPTLPPPRQYGGGLPMNRGRYGNPEEVARDWRDWFIMTVIGGGVGYVLISLARKYLMPALQPPSQTELEAAQAALTAKYDEAAAILETLQSETTNLKADMASQSEKVDGAIKEVRDAMETCMKGETERDEEMEKIKDEVESLKEMLPRALEKQKEAQTASLTDLQNELKSLKSLLLTTRRPDTPSVPSPSASPSSSSAGAGPAGRTPSTGPSRFGYTSSPAFAGLGNRPPGIPAWQLAPNASNSNNAAPPSPTIGTGVNGSTGKADGSPTTETPTAEASSASKDAAVSDSDAASSAATAS